MEENKHNIAPVKLEMLMAVVHNEKAKYYSSLIQAHKANLQFTMPAKGTAHLILQYLGLEEKPKSLIIAIVRSDEAAGIISELEENFKKGKTYKGIAFTVRLTSVIGTMVYGFLANEKSTVKEEA